MNAGLNNAALLLITGKISVDYCVSRVVSREKFLRVLNGLYKNFRGSVANTM
jgi:hypothetical protein